MTIRGGDGATASTAAIAPEPRVGHASTRSALHPVLVTVIVAVLGYVLLAAVTVGFGLVLTRELLHGVIGDLDVDATTWLVERRTPARDDLSRVGSAFSEALTVALILVAALAFLAIRRHWRQFGIVAVAMGVEGAVYVTATFAVERHRPEVPRLEDLIVADSYFSGHTAAAVAMYGSLAIVVWSLTRRPVLRALFGTLVVVAPIVVASSRMYRGMHYASDVAVGLLVGLGCIAVALLAVRAGTRASEAAR